MNNDPENHKNEEANSSHDDWQKAMNDVEFRGDKTADVTESKEEESRKTIAESIRDISQHELEHCGEYLLRPRAEIVCDHDHIEDQRIDIINKKDQGQLEFRFKIRDHTEAISAIIAAFEKDDEEATTHNGITIKKGPFIYEPTNPGSDPLLLCDAFIFEKNGIKVSIANPTSRDGQRIDNGVIMRSAIGLIKIETPLDMTPEDTEKSLNEILEKDLGIPNALSEVPTDAEKEYKIARYKWQHVITEELTPEQTEEAEKLERQEVFPGYTTLVEKGKHREYLATYGEDMRVIHILGSSATSAKSIYRVLTRGLMSSSERFSRGIIREGKSTIQDLACGGADSVFTRILTKKQRESISRVSTTVVLKPELLDRTDWYSYLGDTYGTTSEPSFSERPSPDELLDACEYNQDNDDLLENEQMFRVGIGASFIESIEVDEDRRDGIIAELKSMGLTEVDGKPIELIILARRTTKSKTPATPQTTDITQNPHTQKSKVANFKKPNPVKKFFLDRIAKLTRKKTNE